MIQCDKCLVWQHGPCMGVWNDDEAPDGGCSFSAAIWETNIKNTTVMSAGRSSMVHCVNISGPEVVIRE